MSDDLTTFQRKLAERRAREEAAKASSGSAPVREVFDEDLIPEAPYTKTEADQELDNAVDRIDILQAYRRWCGKMEPKVHTGQRESIMISCPNPSHPDKNPSAWINLDKQIWYCGSCSMGGDAHDIAAFRLGYPVPDYKTNGDFHALRIKMAEDFGFRYETYPGGVKILVGPTDDDSHSDDTTEPQDNGEVPTEINASPKSSGTVSVPEPVIEPEEDSDADVIPLYDLGDEDVIFPSLDWRKIIPKNTFLDIYLRQTTVDDVAEEYHFWNGLIAIGFACGRQARLWDSPPVFGNLFVCTLGHSGSGKSKAKWHLDRLLNDALPHDWTDPSSRGVRRISTIASAEALVHSFQKPISDPSSPKVIMYHAPVSGIIDFNELSALIGRANRQGNALKPTLMQFYDMEPLISTTSLSTGTKEAHEPFASALTTTQPLALRSLLGRSDDDSGFLNRWVFVGGPEKKRIAIGGTLVDIEPAVDPLRRILGWSGSFGDDDFVEWSDEARDSFTDFFHSTIEPDKRKSGSALLTRMDLLMKKLCLLFAANKMEKTVTADTVYEAIQCYEYVKACYGVPEAQIGNSLQQEISEAVLYQAKKQYDIDKRGVSLNQVAKALKRRKYPNDLLLKVMDSLTKLGFLEPEPTPTGKAGRPTVRYRYVG